jgi:hypothetical protein
MTKPCGSGDTVNEAVVQGKVHVLIRGGLLDMATRRQHHPFGEIAGRGDRLTKSWRYQEALPPDSEPQGSRNDGSRQDGGDG